MSAENYSPISAQMSIILPYTNNNTYKEKYSILLEYNKEERN